MPFWVGAILFPVLYPWTWVYRLLFYLDRKRKTPEALSRSFVISVGNLTVGGTGKTPFTVFLLSQWTSKSPASSLVILSRGYGAKASSQGMEIQPDTSAYIGGDEPVLLKKKFPQVRVLIGKDRLQIFQKTFLLQEESSKLVLLEDGFQHHAIKRDLDIVLIDANSKWDDGFVLPLGKGREPLKALQRAQILVWTRCSNSNQDYRDTLANKIQSFHPSMEIFHSTEIYADLYSAKSPEKKISLSAILDLRVLAFTGIGSPRSFFQTLKNQSPKHLQTKAYVDHYSYPREEKKAIQTELKSYDLGITTEKDIVKFLPHEISDNLYVLPIQFSLENEDRFWKLVKSHVSQTASESGLRLDWL